MPQVVGVRFFVYLRQLVASHGLLKRELLFCDKVAIAQLDTWLPLFEKWAEDDELQGREIWCGSAKKGIIGGIDYDIRRDGSQRTGTGTETMTDTTCAATEQVERG